MYQIQYECHYRPGVWYDEGHPLADPVHACTVAYQLALHNPGRLLRVLDEDANRVIWDSRVGPRV